MGEKTKVLVVEDEAIILWSTASLLADQGYEVLEALNADQAVALLESHDDIRIVFSDIMMPGSLDGLRLAAAVKDRWPPVQIILTSGHVPESELPGDVTFFPKPYDLAAVSEAIRAFGSESARI